MSDETRVERVAESIYNVHKMRVEYQPYLWTTFAEQEPRIAEEYRDEARAAIAAINNHPTLEDVLNPDLYEVSGVGFDQDANHWVATVIDFSQGRSWTGKKFSGIGPTIDTAIRAAVASAAKGGRDG